MTMVPVLLISGGNMRRGQRTGILAAATVALGTLFIGGALFWLGISSSPHKVPDWQARISDMKKGPPRVFDEFRPDPNLGSKDHIHRRPDLPTEHKGPDWPASCAFDNSPGSPCDTTLRKILKENFDLSHLSP